MPTLKGKCALITGGGRGIGRAIAERLAADGAAVVIVDFNGTTASETARALSESGARAASLCADVANPEAAAEATAGGRRGTPPRHARTEAYQESTAL